MVRKSLPVPSVAISGFGIKKPVNRSSIFKGIILLKSKSKPDLSERSELAGYVNEGGGLTFVIVRNAGHMVPISQPLRAWDLVTR